MKTPFFPTPTPYPPKKKKKKKAQEIKNCDGKGNYTAL